MATYDVTCGDVMQGSVAVGGAAVRWLRDSLKMIASSSEVEALVCDVQYCIMTTTWQAAEVPDSAGVYFVPAFSGLYAPHWNTSARGLIIGLTFGVWCVIMCGDVMGCDGGWDDVVMK